MLSRMKRIKTAFMPSGNGSDSSSNANNEAQTCENNPSELSIHADLIRAVGMFLVILLHSAVEPHPIVTVPDQAEVFRWWTVTIYQL